MLINAIANEFNTHIMHWCTCALGMRSKLVYNEEYAKHSNLKIKYAIQFRCMVCKSFKF